MKTSEMLAVKKCMAFNTQHFLMKMNSHTLQKLPPCHYVIPDKNSPLWLWRKPCRNYLQNLFSALSVKNSELQKNVIIRQLTLSNRNCMKTKPMSQKLFFALYVFFSSSIQFCLLLNCHFLLMASSFSALIL